MTNSNQAPQPALVQSGGYDASRAGPGYRAYILFILVLVYTFNFLDRQIMGILSVPIQQEFGVKDDQLALLRGWTFALFYATLGVPIAWLADRANRVWIVSGALALWSLMTAACGLAANVWQLAGARLMVGVGEAGGVAPSYSIIADYFPPNRRAGALAIYSFGIPIGSAIGIVFGGVIASLLDWRAAFIIVGLAGVALSPIFFFTMREPKRGGLDRAKAPQKPAPFSEVIRTLMRKPSFWTLSFGAAFSSMMGYGLFAWVPALLVRSYSVELQEFLSFLPSWMFPDDPKPLLFAAYFYGAIVLVGGLIGIFLGGYTVQALGGRSKAAYALTPAFAFLLTAPFFLWGIMADNIAVTFFVFMIPTALGLAWLGPTLAAFQNIAPAHMRTTASAIFLLINNLIGIALGDYILGLMSEGLKAQFGDESLRYSIMAGTSFYVVAAILYFVSARFLEKDWEA